MCIIIMIHSNSFSCINNIKLENETQTKGAVIEFDVEMAGKTAIFCHK